MGGHAIREDFAARMLANDGDSYRRKSTFLTADEFLYEMEWNGTKGKGLTRAQLETSDQIGIKDKTGLYGVGEYFANKFVAWKEDNTKGSWGFKNLTIFRYAEVLLMYAEACAQTDDADGLGLQCLQDVQNRAGSDYVSTQLTLEDVKKRRVSKCGLKEFVSRIWCVGAIQMVLKIMVKTYLLLTMHFSQKANLSIVSM